MKNDSRFWNSHYKNHLPMNDLIVDARHELEEARRRLDNAIDDEELARENPRDFDEARKDFINHVENMEKLMADIKSYLQN